MSFLLYLNTLIGQTFIIHYYDCQNTTKKSTALRTGTTSGPRPSTANPKQRNEMLVMTNVLSYLFPRVFLVFGLLITLLRSSGGKVEAYPCSASAKYQANKNVKNQLIKKIWQGSHVDMKSLTSTYKHIETYLSLVFPKTPRLLVTLRCSFFTWKN